MKKMIKRKYYENIWADFNSENKLILISGPRQAGKTTLVKSIASQAGSSSYFNYDIPKNKAILVKNPTFFEEIDRIKGKKPIVIFDEIHKYKDWKNYLKGIYDGYSDAFSFTATGSGRLELFQCGGESIAGRYRLFHLFPFTIGELFSKKPRQKSADELIEIPETRSREIWETLFNYSGFPEPFVKSSAISYRRWANVYHKQIIREDIRDTFSVKNIDAMETLYALLPSKTGSLLSASNLSGLIKVSHKTVSEWIKVFEKFFLIFTVRPYSKLISRSILKQPKIYFYDFCLLDNPAIKFENIVAVELKRAVTIWTDLGFGSFDLFFIRNKDKKEVDFLITENNEPYILIETKFTDTTISKTLKEFQNLYNIPAIQLINTPGIKRKVKNGKNQILVVTASDWLANLH